MIALSSPISPVTAAALQGPTRYLAIPSFTKCPTCRNQWDGKMPGHFYGSNWSWVPCQTCAEAGRVPLVVKVGDRLTVPINEELPAAWQVFGDWEVVPVDGQLLLTSPGEIGRAIRLVPGGSLSGTVAAWPDSAEAALPIVAGLDRPGDSPAWIGTAGTAQRRRAYVRRYAEGFGVTDEPIEAELAWQDFCPGDQVVLLDDVTVTP